MISLTLIFYFSALLSGLGLIFPELFVLHIPMLVLAFLFMRSGLMLLLQLSVFASFHDLFSFWHEEPCPCGDVHPVCSDAESVWEVVAVWLTLYVPLSLMYWVFDQSAIALLCVVLTGGLCYIQAVEVVWLKAQLEKD